MPDECRRCEQLEAELRRACEERDAALSQIAAERAKAEALSLLHADLVKPAAPKPLRYWAIDALNDGIKKALPWPHAGARAAARLFNRLRKTGP